MNNRIQKWISRIIAIWMFFVLGTFLGCLRWIHEDNHFYHFGPSKNLVILGFTIDTVYKYLALVSYCFINSMMRTLYSTILNVWMMNTIQDETVEKPREINKLAYEINTVCTIYVWFDWFIYMNILLSQIDMVLIEITADLLMSTLTTRYYLSKKNEYTSLLTNA